MTNLVTLFRAEQREAYEREQLRLAYLRGPAPRNDPFLLELVRVRVLKRFGLGADRIAQLGEIVELPRHDAQSLAAIGRVESIT
jgi:hypothetical protein